MDKPDLPLSVATDTPEQREARIDYIFHLIEEGGTIDSSCKSAGVNRYSFTRWRNKDAELMARYEEVQLLVQDNVEEVCKMCALKALDDPRYQTSMIFFLKCRAGWDDRSAQNYESQVEMPSVTFNSPSPSPSSEDVKVPV